jgi:hypothetical protein
MENWNTMYMPGNKGDNNIQGRPNRIHPSNNDSVVNPIEKINDFGKGIRYYTCDGREVATMEQVFQYNQMYYEKMIKDETTEKTGGMHR